MTERLLVCSPGGHLDELLELRGQDPSSDDLWVTARTAQSESVLRNRNAIFVGPVRSGEVSAATRLLPDAIRIIRRSGATQLCSTGAALAAPFLVAGSALRLETTFIESATRIDSPSRVGRLTEMLPGLTRLHQGFDDERRGWSRTESVFDHFTVRPTNSRAVDSVIVTLGSERFPFNRAIAALLDVLPNECKTVWQTGYTDTLAVSRGLAQNWFPAEQLYAHVRASDLVVTHAGVGSVLACLKSGKVPVVIPRLASRGEHTDDHQLELARRLGETGLVAVADVSLPDSLASAIEYATAHTALRQP